jgi:hypothetical protein
MNRKKFALATLAYVLVSFVLGFSWHLVLFKQAYAEFGVYTREPPIFAFGLGSMLLQGLVLAYLYRFFNRGGSPLRTGLRFALVMGVFLWSVAVLAFAAKSNVAGLGRFMTLSSLFHLLQFGLYGLLLGWIVGPEGAR